MSSFEYKDMKTKQERKKKTKKRKDKYIGVLCKTSCKVTIGFIYKCIADIFYVSMIKALSLYTKSKQQIK